MENLRPSTNYVLVEINDSNKWIKFGEGQIEVDTTFEPERRAQQFGKVVAVGNLFYKHRNPNSLSWDVPCEISKDDFVMFHWRVPQLAAKHGKVYVLDEHRSLVFLCYDDLFAVIRDKNVYPLNGWIFVEPIEEQPSTFLVVPDIAKKRSKTRGIVKHVGCKVKGYRDTEEETEDITEINIGDQIAFHQDEAILIQDDLQPLIGILYRMHCTDISGVFSQEREFIRQEDSTVLDA